MEASNLYISIYIYFYLVLEKILLGACDMCGIKIIYIEGRGLTFFFFTSNNSSTVLRFIYIFYLHLVMQTKNMKRQCNSIDLYSHLFFMNIWYS